MSQDDDNLSAQDHNSRAIMPSKRVCEEFIAAYKNHRILWDPSHAFYNSKYKRSKAYDELVTILKQCSATANHELVRKQINCLRTNYRKLHRRYLRSRTVKDGKEFYTFVPCNWRYYHMQFLDSVGKEQTVDDTASDTNANNAPEDTSIRDTTVDQFQCTPSNQSNITLDIEIEETSVDSDENNAYAAIEIVDEASKEEFKVIGRNVALKLKRMSVDQRNNAELLINKILINALKGKLNDATDIVGLPMNLDCDNTEFNDYDDMMINYDNTDFDDEEFQ